MGAWTAQPACARGVGAALALVAAMSLSGCGGGSTNLPSRAIVEIRTVKVGDPGNAAAAIVPFHPGLYKSCDDAPSRRSGCRLVGSVGYDYELGELEVTVRDYVAFLNTVDPFGENRRDLYVRQMSPSQWPKYGSIRQLSGKDVPPGKHYAVAYPQWADKPIGFANFLRAASFANSVTNGEVLSRTTSTAGRFAVTTYRVRLSRDTDEGMYDLTGRDEKGATRARATGFVVPSQDEWIKAAYYDPNGGGTFSYWEYPTGPSKAPNPSELDVNGDVANAGTQPLSTYSPRAPRGATAAVPSWCPPEAGASCESENPLDLSADAYEAKYQANLSTVGETRTRSPWGTLDQGGNVVEWTDTIAPPARGSSDPRVWRYAHGGVANAPAYQLWISAIGRLPEGNVVVERVNPWQGFRIGAIGELESSQ